MYIWNATQKRCNINAIFENEDGTFRNTLVSKEDRDRFGIIEIADPERKDERFYFVNETNDPPYVTNTPKDLMECKKNLISQVKQQAAGMLTPTDWKIIREAEGVKPCTQAVKDYRASVRLASDANEALVNAATTIEELQLVTFTWPENE